MVMEIQVLQKAVNLTSQVTISLSIKDSAPWS